MPAIKLMFWTGVMVQSAIIPVAAVAGLLPVVSPLTAVAAWTALGSVTMACAYAMIHAR